MTQLIVWLAASVDDAECLPSFSFSVPAVLVYSIFRPFVFPKTAICVFRVIGTGSQACFSLSRGFNQRTIRGPWTDIHMQIDTHTYRHTHTLKRRQVALAVCEDTWRKWSIRKRDACHCFSAHRATLQQHLITVPSAQLCWDFPNMFFTKFSSQSVWGECHHGLSWISSVLVLVNLESGLKGLTIRSSHCKGNNLRAWMSRGEMTSCGLIRCLYGMVAN